MNMLEALRDLGERAGIEDCSRMTMTEILIAAAALPDNSSVEPDDVTIRKNPDNDKLEIFNQLRTINVEIAEGDTYFPPDEDGVYVITVTGAGMGAAFVSVNDSLWFRKYVIKNSESSSMQLEVTFPSPNAVFIEKDVGAGAFISLEKLGGGYEQKDYVNVPCTSVVLDNDSKLPSVDGSNLTNVPAVIGDYSIQSNHLASDINISTTGSIAASAMGVGNSSILGNQIQAGGFAIGASGFLEGIGTQGAPIPIADLISGPYQVIGGIIVPTV